MSAIREVFYVPHFEGPVAFERVEVRENPYENSRSFVFNAGATREEKTDAMLSNTRSWIADPDELKK